MMKSALHPMFTGWLKFPLAALVMSSVLFLTACSDNDDNDDGEDTDGEVSAPLFPEGGDLQAKIRRTTNGVPHVKADDLSSAAFGVGYAQAQDNVCVLADAFVKARSERAKYFGPGGSLSDPSDPPINIISDFSYKALDTLSGAERELETLSDESRALVDGFTAGYNKYVAETDPADLPPECRNQPWVMEISSVDLLAYYRIVGKYASGDLFSSGAVYTAVPPEAQPAGPVEVMPQVNATDSGTIAPASIADSARRLASRKKDYSGSGLASNAWGIGSELSEQGRGALLANPHFPYTGHRRLYQTQMTVPGYLNINGAGLLGTAIPLINYNENLAWSHTNTVGRQFTLYELTLKQGDNLTYIKDGEEKPITQKTFQIEMANGTETPTVLEQTFYYSEYGPMLAANLVTGDNPATPATNEGGLAQWGGTNTQGATVAYTYRDANANTADLLDTWLQMSRATNLEEFKDVFRNNCGSTLWVNTTYADNQGNTFYIDSSSVPKLSAAALATVDFKRRFSTDYNALFEGGLTLLDGNTSRDDWVEGECGTLTPYEEKPKLQRTDFVQNSNNSHWATNPDAFLTGFSPLFGPEQAQLNLRTRLGLSMLQNPLDTGYANKAPGGQDGKFSALDLIDVIYNNRAWQAEQFRDELRDRCAVLGTTEVAIPPALLQTSPPIDAPASRSVESACSVVQNWDGLYDIDSRGAHLFRVFVDIYTRNFPDDLTVAFNPADPVNTPASPDESNAGTPEDPMLQSLAASLVILEKVGIDPSARLGDVQYYQPSGGIPPGSEASGAEPRTLSDPIAWHGGDGDIEGTFNAVGVADEDYAEDTRIPRVNAEEFVVAGERGAIRVAGGLSTEAGAGWRIGLGTTYHFGLEFTDNGPKAYGLMSYSQSTDSMSEYFTDQSQRFSEKNYREFAFTEEEIEANLVDQGETTIRRD